MIADAVLPYSGATFSDDPAQRYRYDLWRMWSTKPLLLVVMLNPSTADADRDDPTITRCRNRAQNLGYGGLVVCNLFAYRSPYPAALYRFHVGGGDAVGPGNREALETWAAAASAAWVAWGNHKLVALRERSILDLLYESKLTVSCLGLTNGGYPLHPLHVAYSVPLQRYAGRFAR